MTVPNSSIKLYHRSVGKIHSICRIQISCDFGTLWFRECPLRIRGLLQSSIGCDMDRTPETYACHLFYNHHSEEVRVPHTFDSLWWFEWECCPQGHVFEYLWDEASLEVGTFKTVRTQRQAPKACSSLGEVDRVLKARNKDTQGRWRSRKLHRFWGLTIASWRNLFLCMGPQGCLSGSRILLPPLQQD